jgi:hypothetical protein
MGTSEVDVMCRKAPVGGRVVAIVSYRDGDRFRCRVDNIDPPTVIARGDGPTRSAAEKAAIEVAQYRLAHNRPLHDAFAELHMRVASLYKRISEPPSSSKV